MKLYYDITYAEVWDMLRFNKVGFYFFGVKNAQISRLWN